MVSKIIQTVNLLALLGSVYQKAPCPESMLKIMPNRAIDCNEPSGTYPIATTYLSFTHPFLPGG